jgi:leucine-zipper of insertion element IS481
LAHPNSPLTPEGRRRLCERVDAGRPIAHVAAEAGISRKCLAKWYARWQQHGDYGLLDQSSRPPARWSSKAPTQTSSGSPPTARTSTRPARPTRCWPSRPRSPGRDRRGAARAYRNHDAEPFFDVAEVVIGWDGDPDVVAVLSGNGNEATYDRSALVQRWQPYDDAA